MNTKAGRGRPKKDLKEFQNRNEQILDAARLMFASRGFADTDVEELASELGIGKGTIYRAFPSKQELFFATVDRSLEQMAGFIKAEVAAQQVEGLQKIQTAVKAFLHFFDANPAVIELFIQERAVFSGQGHSSFWEHCRKNSARWETFFSDLMAQGFIRKSDPRWLADTLNQLLYGQLFLHRMDGSQQSLKSKSNDILTIFFVGILTKEALRNSQALGIDLGGLANE